MLIHWEVGEYFPVCLQICRPHYSSEVLRTERLSTGVADEVDGARRHGGARRRQIYYLLLDREEAEWMALARSVVVHGGCGVAGGGRGLLMPPDKRRQMQRGQRRCEMGMKRTGCGVRWEIASEGRDWVSADAGGSNN
jgi:hypothetical protein